MSAVVAQGLSVGTVHVVVPEAVQDLSRPSGGNTYDRRVCSELAASGWSVHEHTVAGPWPDPRPADTDALATLLAGMSGDPVLVDGLVASAAPEVVCRYAGTLRLVVLVHQPLGVVAPAARGRERAMLSQVAAVVTTSEWTRSWLTEQYGLPADRVAVGLPGADPAELAPGAPAGSEMVCVGAVTEAKGHDVLVDALASLDRDRPWRCTLVGSVDIDPTFVRRLTRRVGAAGLAGRVVLTGPLHGAALDAAYRSADVLVLASRAETYGMVVTEALARGLPVIATRAGGVPEAVGAAPGGEVPGVLVPPGDPHALAAALDSWLDDTGRRARLRQAAQARRATLPTWSEAADCVAGVLGWRAGQFPTQVVNSPC